MKINELNNPKIDPLKFSEENQEILLKILPPLHKKLDEGIKRLEFELYLAKKFKDKTDDEFMQILKDYKLAK